MSKASNLIKLRDANFNVPHFVLIPAQVFDHFRAGLSNPVTADEIINGPLSDSLAKQILDIVHPLLNSDLALRSSMADEDSARHSFAGQLDSLLNIRGSDAVLAAVKACWASAYGERARAYRKENYLSADKISMEVIAQVMVPADVSGVIFTADPIARDPRVMMISAAEGLGEALVRGEVTGETVRVNRESGEVEGTGKIINQHVIELVSIAKNIEELFGAPQDIEFAIAENEIFILQARPITSPVYTEHILWDNSNITESYSGVTTPLTFSVIRGSYAQVYRRFLSLIGVQRMDESVLRNLLGLYNGQVYYQLLNWFQALSWLPAFEQNKAFMEQMMGVKQSLKTDTIMKPRGRLALLRWGIRMIGLHFSSEQRSQVFLVNFNNVLAEYQAKDFSTMTPHQLREAYLDLETRVLGEWGAPILNDFLAMIFFGVLRRMSEKWLDPGGSLHNDLLAGDGVIESIQPARRVQALARLVNSDSQLQAAFDLEPNETLQSIRLQNQFASFRIQLDEYLSLYGDRCMNELKLEELNLRDDPLPLIRMIAAAAKNPIEMPVAASPVRAKAEARVSELPFFKRILFRWMMKNARRYVRNRENLRFARSRLFGLLRGILNSLGNQWAEIKLLEQSSDIYYLTIGEIWDFVEGTAVSQSLKGIAALRRAEYAEHKNNSAPLPDRFETFGIPYLDAPRDLLTRPSSHGTTLQGVGCCSGQIRGRTRVVRSVNEVSDLGGEILVAERTDPGWVFLYPSASGILVERGSPLSHSAIVAREMGKPIIMNIPNLTTRIKSGNEVEMDGERGTVRLLSS